MTPPDADPVPGWPEVLRSRFDARLTALGLTGPLRRDTALAVLVALVCVGAVLLAPADPQLAAVLPPGSVPLTGTAVLIAVQSLLLAVRRVAPVACLAGTVLLSVAMLVVLPAGGLVRGPGPAIAAYTCGSRLSARRAVWVLTAAALVETAAALVAALRPGSAEGPVIGPLFGSAVAVVVGQLVSAALNYGAAGLAGANLASRRRYVELVRLRADEAVAAQRALADAAVGRERTRMARELHDVAAHHLSGMVVQAVVVERLMDRDPDGARQAAAWVRQQGKATLRDLRLVVGALREPGAELPGDRDGEPPVPGMAELDRLAAVARELGTDVEVVRHGPPRELAPLADATCYRVAQEALANAREHAPGAPVRLTVRCAGRVTIEIGNPAPAGPAGVAGPHRGFGLAGMRERAQLIGAEFTAGPDGDGGWRVRLVLPAGRAGDEEGVTA